MKALILTIIFSIFSLWAYSQGHFSQDSTIQKHIQNVRSNGIDTVFVYREYCVGCLYPKDRTKRCDNPILNNTHYIFWLKDGKPYFTVIDDCFEYSTLLVDSNIFDYIYSVRDSLLNCKLSEPSIRYGHSGYFRFVLADNINDFETTFNNDFFYVEPYAPNLNPNNRTIVKRFRDSIDSYYLPDLLDKIRQTRKEKNYR